MFLRLIKRGCLDKSEQWLENVDPTHLALASGKLALQKNRDRDLSAHRLQIKPYKCNTPLGHPINIQLHSK